MNETEENLRTKEAALNVHQYILSSFLYDMTKGEKSEFMETPIYKAFFKEYVRVNMEYGKARYEKNLHG